ncbi:MauE/DoxX family redox-associated membrane protein [Nonomuraea sediminis]|uniref:MauE/DoxX family redox-associated membrane protein n=1 Tax=Nonomuraea sediminis TaxID=2835864 RepID=UPI001BDCA96E|nr:MauE/DoxX family redox-associated membrane protein [Nonomuraea sediminis]
MIRYALALVLSYAVVAKARRFPAFRLSLAAYGAPFPGPSAAVVVGVETLTVLAAFSPLGDREVGYLLSALCAAFVVVQTYLLAGGRSPSCTCFGRTRPVTLRSWSRATLMLTASLILATGGT